MAVKSINDQDVNAQQGEESDIPCVKKLKCRTLQIEGTKYRTTFTSKFENRKKYIPFDPGKIISSLPGTVVDVFVKSGQNVKQGQPLVVFEAMKMKNKITAPVDGKIESLNIRKGDIIAKGQLLAEIAH